MWIFNRLETGQCARFALTRFDWRSGQNSSAVRMHRGVEVEEGTRIRAVPGRGKALGCRRPTGPGAGTRHKARQSGGVPGWDRAYSRGMEHRGASR
jgi:hypothetical protein